MWIRRLKPSYPRIVDYRERGLEGFEVFRKNTILGVSNLNGPKQWRLGLVRKGGGSEGRPAASARAASDSPPIPVKFAGQTADAEGVRLTRFDDPDSPGAARALLVPCIALLAGIAGCQSMNLPPTPPPATHEWVDLEHTTSARTLAKELGMKLKAEPALNSLAMEGEYGRIVFMNATRTITVGGKRVEASKELAISGLDLPLRAADAARVRAAWLDFSGEQARETEVVTPEPPAAVIKSRRPVAAGSDPAWRVPLKRTWEGILIHHSATPNGNMAQFDKYHREVNGWLMIGYDFVIDNGDGAPDGLVETTNRWKQQIQGAHAGKGQKRYNDHWVGICLVGDFNDTRPTRAQMDSLKKLIRYLQAYCDIPDENIKFHRDVRDTDCPGSHFPTREILKSPPRAK